MYGFLWKISGFEVGLLTLNCVLALSAGLILSIFPDMVQRYQLEQRPPDEPRSRWAVWLAPLFEAETRFIASPWYVRFLELFGYACLLLAGIFTGFLVTYIMRL